LLSLILVGDGAEIDEQTLAPCQHPLAQLIPGHERRRPLPLQPDVGIEVNQTLFGLQAGQHGGALVGTFANIFGLHAACQQGQREQTESGGLRDEFAWFRGFLFFIVISLSNHAKLFKQ